MDKNTKLKATIELYERGQLGLKELLSSVTEISGKVISQSELENYWTYTTLDDFCETVLVEEITDWQNIDDTTALSLIKQIIDNSTNEGIRNRNENALEKRYRKSTGFLTGLIFNLDSQNEFYILQQLKKDTIIYL